MINSDVEVRVFSKLIARIFKSMDLKRVRSEFHGSPTKAQALVKCFEFKIPGYPGLLEGVEQDVRLVLLAQSK